MLTKETKGFKDQQTSRSLNSEVVSKSYRVNGSKGGLDGVKRGTREWVSQGLTKDPDSVSSLNLRREMSTGVTCGTKYCGRTRSQSGVYERWFTTKPPFRNLDSFRRLQE